MFTGIITAIGQITTVEALGKEQNHGKRLTIKAPIGYLNDVELGDSIALNGACMTVTTLNAAENKFTVEISAESLSKTAGLDQLKEVNLEKALCASERFGGHMVLGHVDGIGRVVGLDSIGESILLKINAPQNLAQYLAYKGSITVQGVSLTVNQVKDLPDSHCEFSINLIAHTFTHTTLKNLKLEDQVNLEVDVIARYVARMLELDKENIACIKH